jgi:hypothetical protein
MEEGRAERGGGFERGMADLLDPARVSPHCRHLLLHLEPKLHALPHRQTKAHEGEDVLRRYSPQIFSQDMLRRYSRKILYKDNLRRQSPKTISEDILRKRSPRINTRANPCTNTDLSTDNLRFLSGREYTPAVSRHAPRPPRPVKNVDRLPSSAGTTVSSAQYTVPSMSGMSEVISMTVSGHILTVGIPFLNTGCHFSTTGGQL